MTPQQHTCVMHAIKSIQEARKWLDQAMYYTGDPMPDEDFRKVREAYDLICSANEEIRI